MLSLAYRRNASAYRMAFSMSPAASICAILSRVSFLGVNAQPLKFIAPNKPEDATGSGAGPTSSAAPSGAAARAWLSFRPRFAGGAWGTSVVRINLGPATLGPNAGASDSYRQTAVRIVPDSVDGAACATETRSQIVSERLGAESEGGRSLLARAATASCANSGNNAASSLVTTILLDGLPNSGSCAAISASTPAGVLAVGSRAGRAAAAPASSLRIRRPMSCVSWELNLWLPGTESPSSVTGRRPRQGRRAGASGPHRR